MRILAILLIISGLLSCVSGRGKSTRVSDPKGRFSFSKSSKFELKSEREDFFHYYNELENKDIYIMSFDVLDSDEGLEASFSSVNQNFNDYYESGAVGLGNWELKIFLEYGSDKMVALGHQYRKGVFYIILVKSDDPNVNPSTLSGPIMDLFTKFKFSEEAGEAFKIETREQLEEYIGKKAEKNAGALSVAIMEGDSIKYSYFQGNASLGETVTEDTAFKLGSISKLFTATAIMQLGERGLLSIDDPVSKYLPEIESSDLTIKHLLTHRGGLIERPVTHIIGSGDTKIKSIREVLDTYISREYLKSKPGEKFEYNNWGYLMLGNIVEVVSGEEFTQYVNTNIMKPLGMNSTSYDYRTLSVPIARSIIPIPLKKGILQEISQGNKSADYIYEENHEFFSLNHVNILPPWGGVTSTTEDLLKLGNMYLNRGSYNGIQILGKKSLKSMKKIQKTSSGEKLNMGLGFETGKDSIGRYYGHGGGGPGLSCLLRFYPKKNITVVVFGNFTRYNPEFILTTSADLYLQKEL